jgi:TatD DNase family protein
MEFIDSHTHLYLPEFDADRSMVIENAIHAGVNRMLLPNVDIHSVEPMLAMCKTYPDNCIPMVGLHPTSVKADFMDQLTVLEKHLNTTKFIAIGEVGIDLYWDKTFLSQQEEAFAFQIDLSRKYSLPLVIHSREAFSEIATILHRKCQSEPYVGVFHSFSGTIEQAFEIIALGFKIGISGVVTFKNSKMDEVVRNIPLKHILLETDSPYLTPIPKRGQRNESAYIPYIAQKISDIQGVALEEVARITTLSTKVLFNLK